MVESRALFGRRFWLLLTVGCALEECLPTVMKNHALRADAAARLGRALRADAAARPGHALRADAAMRPGHAMRADAAMRLRHALRAS